MWLCSAQLVSDIDSSAISAGSHGRAAADPDQPDAVVGPTGQNQQRQVRRKEMEQSFLLINIARLLTQSGRSKAGYLSDQSELKIHFLLESVRHG